MTRIVGTWLRSFDPKGANFSDCLVAGRLGHEVRHELVGTLGPIP